MLLVRYFNIKVSIKPQKSWQSLETIDGAKDQRICLKTVVFGRSKNKKLVFNFSLL